MDGRQLVDMLDILRSDAEKSGIDFDQLYQTLSDGIQDGSIRILRHGNSLLIYKILSQGVAEVHLATMDFARDIVEALKSFYHAFVVAGFKRLVTESDDDQIVRLLNAAKIPNEAMPSQDGYQITIEVKQ